MTFFDRDLPSRLTGVVEIGDFVTILDGPLRDGFRALGAVKIDDQVLARFQSAITSLASMSGNGHTAPRKSNAKYPSPRWRALSSALECKLMNPVAICIPGIAVLAGESGKAALIAAAVVCGAVCGVF